MGHMARTAFAGRERLVFHGPRRVIDDCIMALHTELVLGNPQQRRDGAKMRLMAGIATPTLYGTMRTGHGQPVGHLIVAIATQSLLTVHNQRRIRRPVRSVTNQAIAIGERFMHVFSRCGPRGMVVARGTKRSGLGNQQLVGGFAMCGMAGQAAFGNRSVPRNALELRFNLVVAIEAEREA